jgi:hypothetical protein
MRPLIALNVKELSLQRAENLRALLQAEWLEGQAGGSLPDRYAL